MLLPFLAALGPEERPDPRTPNEPEIVPSPPEAPPTPPEPEVAPPSEPPTRPDPEILPPGVPFVEPEPDVPEGPGISDPDLAPGLPVSPPDYTPEPPRQRRALDFDRMETYDERDDVPFDTASLPPDHPAYDRIQSRPSTKRSARSRAGGLLVALALIAAGLTAAYFLFRPEASPADLPDLLTLTADNAEAVTLEVMTGDLDEAEDFIIGEFGWPIRVPVFPDARLEGVGAEALLEGVEVPVLRYVRDGAPPVVVYAFDYAFLDAASDHLRLGEAVYARLADSPPVDVRRVGDLYLVLWRRRSVIYTAVTPDDPAPLVEYLRRR